ncbi:UNVERIFIED_CONTAM: putative ribonuclease H protein [Sesamum radiatum]|uniref:Ribonuclease H protein n=1 Tax=Sesamum radiatum TaxID=300843 RepID=A0AAW2TYB6_SESRA
MRRPRIGGKSITLIVFEMKMVVGVISRKRFKELFSFTFTLCFRPREEMSEDRVDFLEHMLSKVGFYNRIVSLIMLCVKSVTYSFMLNGMQFGFVKPERGIRQGDPLSPYLFILCAEGFSCLLQAKENSGDIHGVAVVRRAPRVSHLLFADDTLIFCQATKEAMGCIRGILETYERASGQLINLEKSSIFFSRNTAQENRVELAARLGVRIDSMPAKYLGLPYFIGRNKRDLFNYIRTRVWDRVSGWKEKVLSHAGKEILIKSIVQSIPSYCMSCFKLPDSLLREIKSIAANFFWSNAECNKIHWVSWDKMCITKKDGGLGFRKMQTFNIAMLAKQGWRIMTNPQLLISRILKARYFPNNDFLHAKIGYTSSFTWRSILAARYVISKGIRWRVGDGQSIRVWNDPWLPRPSTFLPITTQSLFLPDLRSIPLGQFSWADTIVWHYNNNGKFSVKSAAHLAQSIATEHRSALGGQCSTSFGSWKFIWYTKVPNKVKVFLWRLCKEAIPTSYNLLRRRCAVEKACLTCSDDTENSKHVLLECPYARQVRKSFDDEQFNWFAVLCWRLWGRRNGFVMENRECTPFDCVTFGGSLLFDFRNSVAVKPSDLPSRNTWQPPDRESIKINFDAAIFDNGKGVGLGTIAQDWRGNCLTWRTMCLPNACSPEHGEAMAARLAMEVRCQGGWTKCIIEGDCLQVVNKLQNKEEDLSVIGCIIADIHRLIPLWGHTSFSFTRRLGNQAAHLLANSTMGSVEGIVPPVFLYEQIRVDAPLINI